MALLHIKLVTPEHAVLEMDATEVTLPIAEGEVTILPEHAPYIGALQAGEMVVHLPDGKTESLAVSGGFVEFDNNLLSVLADTAERAEEIDVARAETARKLAEDIRNQKVSMGEEEYARVAAALEKEMTRIKVARKHRSRGGPSITSE